MLARRLFQYHVCTTYVRCTSFNVDKNYSALCKRNRIYGAFNALMRMKEHMRQVLMAYQ